MDNGAFTLEQLAEAVRLQGLLVKAGFKGLRDPFQKMIKEAEVRQSAVGKKRLIDCEAPLTTPKGLYYLDSDQQLPTVLGEIFWADEKVIPFVDPKQNGSSFTGFDVLATLVRKQIPMLPAQVLVFLLRNQSRIPARIFTQCKTLDFWTIFRDESRNECILYLEERPGPSYIYGVRQLMEPWPMYAAAMTYTVRRERPVVV
jgi:hypothetical protein